MPLEAQAGKQHRGIDQGQPERDPVYAGHVRYLNEGQVAVLRVSQQFPGKSGKQGCPQVFGGGPEYGYAKQQPGGTADAGCQTGEQGRIESKIGG